MTPCQKLLKQEGTARRIGVIPTSYFIFNDFYTCKYSIQHLYIHKCKNEVGCRDDTVPKTVDTRRHCEED